MVKDCRHFSGYKPCGKNDYCTDACPQKDVVKERILIVHLEALGAVLRATGVLRAIKKKWPHSHITWVTNPNAVPLLENNPFIDRLIKNDHFGVLALSTLEFDFSFCVDKSLTAGGLLKVPARSGEMRGFGVDGKTGTIVPLNPEAQRLYAIGLSNHEKFFVNHKSEIQLIIESLALPYDREEYVFALTQQELLFRENEKQRLGLSRPTKKVIGLNTGCSNTIAYKKLTVEGWVKLIELLVEAYPRTSVLLLGGGTEDRLRNEEIFKRTQNKTILTPCESGLRQGAVYVDLCDAIITGDSLGMHMAIALKKWVVAWFGPTCLHEIEFYGRGEGVNSTAPCSPCWKRSCDKKVMCYDQVDFHKIVRLVGKGLQLDKVLAPHARKISDLEL